MELIAPWNKESLFLTCTTYNSSSEPILASASVEKDQPFFNTAGGGVYIAAESFRLSAFAKDIGYVYQMLKPEWFISGRNSERDPDQASTYEATNLRTDDMRVVEGTQYMRMKLVVDQTNVNVSNISRLLPQYAVSLNDYRVCKGCSIGVTPDDNSQRAFELLNDPTETLQGQGFGIRGLSEVPFEVIEVRILGARPTAVILDSEGHIGNWCMSISVLKRDLPHGTSLDELKKYFSSGLYCFSDEVKNSPEEWSYQGRPVLQILGPWHLLVPSVQDKDGTEVDVQDIQSYQPLYRMSCREGKVFEIGTPVEIDYYDEDGIHETLDGTINHNFWKDWAFESSVAFQFLLGFAFTRDSTTYPQVESIIDAAAVFDDVDGYGVSAFVQKCFYTYRTDANVADQLYAMAKLRTTVGPDLQDYTTDMRIHLHGRPDVLFSGTTARTISTKEYPALSPNEMFQIYNGADSDGEAMWLLNGHANGGFQIKIMQDMSELVVNKDLFDTLGLDPQLISYETVHDGATRQMHFILIKTERPDDTGNAVNTPHPINQNFSNYVSETPLSELTTWDGNMINPSNIDSYFNTIVHKIGEPEATGYFRVINAYIRNANGGTERRKFRKESMVQDGPDGPEIVFNNVSKGDYIQNLQYVSMESFALFEAIQICVPSLPFSGMVTSFSSAQRVLAELRLDFPVGPQAGLDGTNQGTNDFWVGDIHWSANNGHQYLQLSTAQQSIYNLQITAQMVYRDANRRVPKPIMLAPNGGLFQCKIRLVSVK